MTIDGISSVGPATMGAISELFPSFNAIEEIRISETINPAEYGGVADISTISKSGTNHFHGGLFENFQNSELNASNTFSNQTPTLKMNNFGAYMGALSSSPSYTTGRIRRFSLSAWNPCSFRGPCNTWRACPPSPCAMAISPHI